MNWGIDFSGELRKMKDDMDRAWFSLFEKDREEGTDPGEDSATSAQTRKKRR